MDKSQFSHHNPVEPMSVSRITTGRRVLLGLLPFLLLGTLSFAGDVPSEVRQSIEPHIAAGEISGAVALVVRKEKIEAFEAIGLADLETRQPMQKDSLFWIASMTKPMVGVALMMLAEEGKLDISDDLEKHLPEFKDSWMLVEKSGSQMNLKRPARKVTLLDVATHTAGIPNVSEPRNHSTLAELVSLVSQRPLEFEPGSVGRTAQRVPMSWGAWSRWFPASTSKNLSNSVCLIPWG
jgi:CubicO group peptidase (beta-lactamase class C family)